MIARRNKINVERYCRFMWIKSNIGFGALFAELFGATDEMRSSLFRLG